MIAADIPTQVANGTRGSEVMATLGVPDAFLAPYPDDRELRIVAVGGPGCACPCGGTHVLSTGQLRGLTITKVRGRRSGLVAWSWAHCLRVCVCVCGRSSARKARRRSATPWHSVAWAGIRCWLQVVGVGRAMERRWTLATCACGAAGLGGAAKQAVESSIFFVLVFFHKPCGACRVRHIQRPAWARNWVRLPSAPSTSVVARARRALAAARHAGGVTHMLELMGPTLAPK